MPKTRRSVPLEWSRLQRDPVRDDGALRHCNIHEIPALIDELIKLQIGNRELFPFNLFNAISISTYTFYFISFCIANTV